MGSIACSSAKTCIEVQLGDGESHVSSSQLVVPRGAESPTLSDYLGLAFPMNASLLWNLTCRRDNAFLEWQHLHDQCYTQSPAFFEFKNAFNIKTSHHILVSASISTIASFRRPFQRDRLKFVILKPSKLHCCASSISISIHSRPTQALFSFPSSISHIGFGPRMSCSVR
jgi:hypothetical protein